VYILLFIAVHNFPPKTLENIGIFTISHYHVLELPEMDFRRRHGSPAGKARTPPMSTTANSAAELTRVPPHSIEAEACVLGSMILDSSSVDIVVQLIQSDCFYRPAHQYIFQAIVDLRQEAKPIDLVMQKPYTGTHNSGYTECQEFYGAITLNSNEPLGERIVTMLDIAIRGVGNMWNDIVIPGLDYLVVEKTLGKYGKHVKTLNRLPVNVQYLVGQR
jgi:hypothetical protein